MTKQELIERIAQRLEKTRDGDAELPKKTVAMLVDSVFAELGDYFIKARVTRKSPRFTYPGFGTFTKKEKRARAGRDPRSGEAIEIPARTTVAFAPGQEMKAGLNRPRAAKAARRGRA
jgi:DNA-binding protein HU-beta